MPGVEDGDRFDSRFFQRERGQLLQRCVVVRAQRPPSRIRQLQRSGVTTLRQQAIDILQTAMAQIKPKRDRNQ
jgi:hypothetical protein